VDGGLWNFPGKGILYLMVTVSGPQGLFTRTMKVCVTPCCRYALYNATKVMINPMCVAWCFVTRLYIHEILWLWKSIFIDHCYPSDGIASIYLTHLYYGRCWFNCTIDSRAWFYETPISAEMFFGQIFTLDFGTNFHPKNTCVPDCLPVAKYCSFKATKTPFINL
jgi:hypothetical protein